MKTSAAALLAPVLLAATILAGCSSDRRSNVVGIKMPGDAGATLLTDLPAQEVASCIAGGLRVAAQAQGDGYLVAGAGERPVRYRVHPIADKLERFTTQVDQLGTTESSDFIASTCLARPRA